MIKLILSILLPLAFVANFWVCEWLYPGSGDDWAIFIPMDELAHNFWSAIIFGYAVVSMLKTVYSITDYFLFLGICFSLCDVTARAAGWYQFNLWMYVSEFIFSIIIAGILYGIRYGAFKRE